MGRRSVLPLPDHQARRIRTAAQEIDAKLGPNCTGREFVREILPVLHSITGEILGATTIRQLLRQLADRTPSTTAVGEEVARYKQSLPTALANLSVAPYHEGDAPAAPDRLAGHAQPLGPKQSVPTAVSVTAELARFHAAQLDYFREQLQLREAQAAAAERVKEEALLEAAAATAKLAGLAESVTHLQAQCTRLTEALAQEQERARAENRQNMLRVDSIRAETRAVEEKLRLARQLVAQRDQELIAVRTERDALAQRSAALQQRVSAAKQSS